MASILVVDDDPDCRAMMAAALGDLHRVLLAADGPEALSTLERDRIDVVLLDLLLPGMSGLEALHSIRAGAQGSIPVLIITSLDEPGMHSAALAGGADDYILKPFAFPDLSARITVAVANGHQRRATMATVQELQEHRDDLLQLLLHDLKNTLAVIKGNLHFLADELKSNVELSEPIADTLEAANTQERMLANLLDVGRAESGGLVLHRAPVLAADILGSIIASRRVAARARGIALEVEVPPSVSLDVDRDLVQRMLENIIDNAFRFVKRGGRVVLRCVREVRATRFEVGNTGAAIPVEHRRIVFEKYGHLGRRGSSTRMNLGLGLYFCRLAAEAHAGTIHVEERPELPSTFVIRIPDCV